MARQSTAALSESYHYLTNFFIIPKNGHDFYIDIKKSTLLGWRRQMFIVQRTNATQICRNAWMEHQGNYVRQVLFSKNLRALSWRACPSKHGQKI